MLQDKRILCIFILVQILIIARGEPYEGLDGNGNGNRNAEEQVDSGLDNYSLVDNIHLPSSGESKQMKIMKYPSDYADYDYYLNARRGLIDMDLNAAVGGNGGKMSYGETTSINRPTAEVRSLPWYGQANKPTGSLPLYPSRSYDPYIRRYDRFDEQYHHRSYPQYFEDMYMHRQRFDPYDSYSPRVPQYPDPYVMYPDRYLDTPTARDYIKSRRAYIDDVPAVDSFNINAKYNPHKLPDLTLPIRNERVVYYAHLPEIVRTPYDGSRSEDRNSASYKPNKKKIKNIFRPLANNSTNYKMSL
ncbi:uncharacterized protein Dwil_GK25251 [Drosophila willistoni]|uniref:Uncharacterized protein n=1 Tax=Drosophila willistoni TaxID=7260 RepID=B4NEM7_DROWI|nr:uncharacterized protein LOC6648552 [Drosophila willistoni]EDW82196.2 uncharacterized protein Dwil_GK25251 [Drosophila willistoni]